MMPEKKPDEAAMTKEERNLAKMVMPKKSKRLLEKIEYSKKKKASKVNDHECIIILKLLRVTTKMGPMLSPTELLVINTPFL